jgi:hypothetical protein
MSKHYLLYLLTNTKNKTDNSLKNNNIQCNKNDIFYKLLFLYFLDKYNFEDLESEIQEIIDESFWELI